MTRITTLADPEAVAARAAREIADLLAGAVARRGVAHLALSGGETPERTYELLAERVQSWEGVQVWFADERCVPPEHEQSNYRMAAEKLLRRIALAPGSVHRMLGELGPQEGAKRYEAELRQHVRSEAEPRKHVPSEAALRERLASAGERVPVLDVVVLGIGPEGHVASLFPDAPTLAAGEDAVCLPVQDSPKPPPERITLSLAVLRAARRCLLLATGQSKAQAIAAALAEPSGRVPASLLRRERLTVIVDDESAPPAPPRA